MLRKDVKTEISPHFYLLPSVILLFIVAYHKTLIWMYERYIGADSYYSHGFLIPFVSGYLIWIKRHQLEKLPLTPSIFGLILIIIASIFHIFGTILYVFSISGFSIFLFILGYSLFIFGKDVTKDIKFPILFLFFMFPIPLAFINGISFPLKMLVAKYGVQIVSFLGIPVFRQGFNITIPQGNLLVGNPCSGLRSMLAFLAIGSLMAYISTLPSNRKYLLFLLSVPVSLLANMIRIPLLVFWSYKFGISSAVPGTFVHTGSGVIVFIVGVLLLYFSMRIMDKPNEK